MEKFGSTIKESSWTCISSNKPLVSGLDVSGYFYVLLLASVRKRSVSAPFRPITDIWKVLLLLNSLLT